MRALPLAALAVAAATACKDADRPPPERRPPPGSTAPGGPAMFGDTPAAPADPAAAARAIWESACVTCHGPRGAGDGPAARGIQPPPRDHGDPAWQDQVTDRHLADVIVGGGRAVGLSEMMPGRPDLAQRPEVLHELIALIRSFRRRS